MKKPLPVSGFFLSASRPELPIKRIGVNGNFALNSAHTYHRTLIILFHLWQTM